MPRIRNWQDLHFYRPDKASRYAHIDTLFTATVDWDLIETLLPDMLRVALSVQRRPHPSLGDPAPARHLQPQEPAVLRLPRAGPAWSAPIFLLNYLSSLELRHLIQAATNKSELFNKYAQWVAFGESGLVTEGVRDEQRKMIKYNHLVANLLIFHTIVEHDAGAGADGGREGFRSMRRPWPASARTRPSTSTVSATIFSTSPVFRCRCPPRAQSGCPSCRDQPPPHSRLKNPRLLLRQGDLPNDV